MLKTNQTYFKNLAVIARFLKYVWPFLNIMKYRVNKSKKYIDYSDDQMIF